MSNITLNKNKKQQTHKDYIVDCNKRKFYNLEISKKLNNAINSEEEFLQNMADIDYRYNQDIYNLSKFKNQCLNMKKCCNRFFSETWFSESLDDTKRKQKPFTTCKNKFCAICCKIRSNKLFHQTYDVVEYIKENEEDFIPFHLTLTVKNPKYAEFSNYYKIMNDAIHDLLDKKTSVFKLTEFVLGWQCAREISQCEAAKEKGTLHPHLHILLLLKKSFIKGRVKKIKNDDILKEWNYALKIQDPNFPDCTEISFNKITKSKLKNDLSEAIAEVSKYPTKPSDMLNMPDDVLLDLLKNLSGARMVTFGGIIRKTRKLLKMKSDEVVDSFTHEELYELQNVKLYNFNGGIYKRQNIKKSDLLEYRVQHSSLLTELTYANDKQKITDRAQSIQQFLEQDFSDLNKIPEIAKYNDYENIAISDTAAICKVLLKLGNDDFIKNQEIKYFEKMQNYINVVLYNQLIFYKFV